MGIIFHINYSLLRILTLAAGYQLYEMYIRKRIKSLNYI